MPKFQDNSKTLIPLGPYTTPSTPTSHGFPFEAPSKHSVYTYWNVIHKIYSWGGTRSCQFDLWEILGEMRILTLILAIHNSSPFYNFSTFSTFILLEFKYSPIWPISWETTDEGREREFLKISLFLSNHIFQHKNFKDVFQIRWKVDYYEKTPCNIFYTF
jgi:hypothetical protein